MESQNAVLVVAHPDDEVLWFSSVLDSCKSVIVCFGPSHTSAENWDSGRDIVMKNYPLGKAKFLRLNQAGALNTANWKNPQQTSNGLRLRGHANIAYQGNGDELLHILEADLRHENVVLTHNPWGEYGHEEHVQVFRVLSKLKESLGFELYVNTYVSNKSSILMAQTLCALVGEPAIRTTNKAIAASLKDLYLQHNCWTFDTDFEWPIYEAFYRVIYDGHDEVAHPRSSSLLLNYLVRKRGQRAGPIKEIAKRFLPPGLLSLIKRRAIARRESTP